MDIRETAANISNDILVVVRPANSTPRLEEFLSFITEVNTTSQCLCPVFIGTEEEGRKEARRLGLPFCLYVTAGVVLSDFRYTLKMVSEARAVKAIGEGYWFEVLKPIRTDWAENQCVELRTQTIFNAMGHLNSNLLERVIFENEPADDLNKNQQQFVEYTKDKQRIFKNRVYFTDGESPYFEVHPSRPTTFVGVPSSFKLEYMAYRYGYGDRTTVIYTDVSHAALKYRRHLIEKWDGHNYKEFAYQYMEDNDMRWQIQTSSTKEKQFEERCDIMFNAWAPGAFPSFWQDFTTKVDFQYTMLDLVSHCDFMLSLVPDNSVVWWSNVFDYFYSAFTHRRDEVQMAHQKLLDGMAAKNDVIVYERDPEYVIPKRG